MQGMSKKKQADSSSCKSKTNVADDALEKRPRTSYVNRSTNKTRILLAVFLQLTSRTKSVLCSLLLAFVPGHALREKSITDTKKGDCSFVQQPGRKSAVGPVDKTGYQPLVNRSLCSSIGLYRISPGRASEKAFKRRFFDALEGMRDACLLGELFCRRPVLAGPAPPSLPAVRPDRTSPCCVRVLGSTSHLF